MSSRVTPRSGRGLASPQQRWSAPPKSKGFSRAISTPEQITRDVRGLKLRQRVSIVLGDEILREELEEVVGSVDMQEKTTDLHSFRTYQDFLIPTKGIRGGISSFAGAASTPVSDIRGIDTVKYSKEERLLRCKLASVYRLAATFNWITDIDHNVLCTARALEDEYYYFAPPQGLLPGEVTAGGMVKMDQEGNTVEEGTTNLAMDKTALAPHCSIYQTKSDANCVIFLTSPVVKAVSVMDYGLLPISHEAAAVGEITYHTSASFVFDKEEKEAFTQKLASVDKVVVLRNVGAMCMGKSVEETCYNAYLLHKACEYQIQAVRAGVDNLFKLDDEVREKIYKSVQDGDDDNQNKRKIHNIHFEGWMRMLDGKGHKTGYEFSTQVFKQPSPPVTSTPSKAKSPAKSISFRFATPSGKERSPVHRSHTTGHRTKIRWLNEPVKSTVYKPEPNLETEKDKEVFVQDDEKDKSDQEKAVVVEEAVSAETEAPKESALEVTFDEPHTNVVTETVETQDEPSGQMTTVTTTTVTETSKNEITVVEGDSPGSAEGGKKRKKVKKSRSFMDRLRRKKSPEKKSAEV